MSKFFWLVSVATIAGAFAVVEGCSSDSTTATTEDDAGTDSSTPRPPRDAAPPEPVDSGPQTCPTLDPISEADIAAKWMPPPAIVDGGEDGGDGGVACTQANIDALKAAFAASMGSVKYTDIKTALGAQCTACAFSPFVYADGGLAQEWSVFVDVDGGAIDNRSGSCFAHRVDNNCGKLRYEFEQCLRIACKDCDTAQAQKCRQDAQKDACKAITNSYASACADEVNLLKVCNIYGAIATQCSGGVDAGIDASAQ